MKPDTLRTLLSGMGTEVLRIYLAAENHEKRSGRVRAGGNKKKNFTEGWVEFEDKRRAKRIASTLNNTPIGGTRPRILLTRTAPKAAFAADLTCSHLPRHRRQPWLLCARPVERQVSA